MTTTETVSAEERDQRIAEVAQQLEGSGLTDEERILIATRRVDAEQVAAAPSAATPAAGAPNPSALGTAAPAPAATDAAAEPALAISDRAELLLVLACAFGAAAAYKVTNFCGYGIDMPGDNFYVRNLMYLVLPFLAIYFAVRVRLRPQVVAAIAGIFAATAAAVNLYPYIQNSATEFLTGLHLPVLLWLVAGVAYAGGAWRSTERRMEYTKFTGEWIINFSLVTSGLGLLVGITIGILEAVGLDATTFMVEWVLPGGVMAAVVVAGWLVAKRRGLSAGIAPWLAKVFTPLFALMVLAVLVAIAFTFDGTRLDREVLIIFDLLLVVVTALLLYGIAARDAAAKPGAFDWIQFVLVAGAIILNGYALVSMGGRLLDMGLTPNRIAAFGLNIILLVNLGWSAVLQLQFLRGARPFSDVATWQMRYLPVYAAWAAVVALVLPPAFKFI